MVGDLTRGDEDASLHRADGTIKGIDRRAQPAADPLQVVGEDGQPAVQLTAEF
jgi:hypothetical protein